ncbi:MAG TPA: hypothetical protein VFE33_26630 [Thermoanaerobaculia bacterium]|nr:hypothetical protein [Thermoanaerobaculia bacterium]
MVDPITPLRRVEALASATGAKALPTDDNHHSYLSRSAGRIMAAVEAP